MKVILLERLGRTGGIGDEVNVRDGFARNFLLPQGKALRASEPNRARFQTERASIEKRNAERREEAAGIAKGLNGHQVIMVRQAGETGQLYGSVSARDISDALARDGFNVGRGQVGLTQPIKTVGVHDVTLNLHAEVAVGITINIARSEDEARRQAAGEDLTRGGYDDDDDDNNNAAADTDALAPDGLADEDEAQQLADSAERQEDA